MSPYEGLKSALMGIRTLVGSFIDGEKTIDLENAKDAFRQIEMIANVALVNNVPRNCDLYGYDDSNNAVEDSPYSGNNTTDFEYGIRNMASWLLSEASYDNIKKHEEDKHG